MVAPPPVPELLHWVIVAFVVLPIGLQETGFAPPPPPEPLHWLMVAGELSATPVMLLVIFTVQVTVPPPPLPEPLHWSTEVTRLPDGVTVVTQVGRAPAAPWHSRIVKVELVTPVARSRLLTTVTSHCTAWPPTLSVPLHWLTATLAAEAGGVADGAHIDTIQMARSTAPKIRTDRALSFVIVTRHFPTAEGAAPSGLHIRRAEPGSRVAVLHSLYDV